MNLGFIRVLFVLTAAVLGNQIGSVLFGLKTVYGLYGTLIGMIVAAGIVLFERFSTRVSLRGLSAAVFGIILALIISNLLSAAIDTIDMDTAWRASLKLVIVLVLSYLGVVFSLRGRDEFNVVIPYVKFQRQDEPEFPVVMDTSAIIDGRISDVVETRFLEGYFVVPRFVLKELQQVADSADPLKRHRGRRGLEVLNRLKKNPKFNYRISVEDFPDISEVDQKLIRLAKAIDARILTTDYNLNRVAEFHGITVLNLNELANALKPVVLPGEVMEVKPIKEGREKEQAVAYLEDGTMVVVENARHLIGQTLRVRVTSALQTPAGRLIFARADDTPQA